MFRIEPTLEMHLRRIDENPEVKEKMSAALRQQVKTYAELKAQSELPEGERPRRRAIMTAKEKADFIAAKGAKNYMALPF